ncbi:AlbA family DNA-binding domain-containing protein [Levilactobacillus mulengensis]|uniref:AlbA family DNA-binding domain-containing protein n=1 Tax=Levilactobacillus mulengensis TaxID=2486025 RepID=UPI000F798735|nr:RNA-binding domain-containing protein [Levilactobacillus mulengensis]
MKKLPIEGNRLEYKETAKHGLPRSIWESVSAFANTAGGKIILGVSEVKKNKEFNVIGVADPNKLKIDFLNLQNDKSTISQAVVGSDDVEVETIEGKEIVVIKVPKVSYKKRPIYIKGNIKKTFYRDHEADRQASDELLRYFLRESDTTTDSELLSGFDLDDLDLVSLQNYKVFLSQQSQEDEYLTKNFSEFLKMIGLMQRNRALKDKKWQLTKAALLLFGKYNSIIEVFPKFFLDFIVKRNSSDVDYLDRIYTSNEAHHPQNIYSFFEQTFQKIQSQLDNKFELDGINRKDNGEVLLAAVREGLVNCLIHADYSAESQIKISLFKDLKVESTQIGFSPWDT